MRCELDAWEVFEGFIFLTIFALSLALLGCIQAQLLTPTGCIGYGSKPLCLYVESVAIISVVLVLMFGVFSALRLYVDLERRKKRRLVVCLLVADFIGMLVLGVLWFVCGIVASTSSEDLGSCDDISGGQCGCARAMIGLSWGKKKRRQPRARARACRVVRRPRGGLVVGSRLTSPVPAC